MRLEMSCSIDWDSVLTRSPDNPYPLAPRDLVEAGKVDEANYRWENRKLGRFSEHIVLSEFARMGERKRRKIEMFGPGIGRELGLVPALVRQGFHVAIRDESEVACRKARRFLLRRGIREQVEVTQGDVEELWENGVIKEKLIVAYYAGQFIQVQSYQTMWSMMSHFGRYLCLPGLRRVYLVHLLGEDNPDYVGIRSTPYTLDDLREPVAEGLQENPEISVLGKHRYFHHTYTFLRIGRA